MVVRYKSEESRKKVIEKLEMGRKVRLEQYERNRVLYGINPKKCKNCDKEISFEKKDNDFCNRSCAAKYGNVNSSSIVRK
jgi:hypothetical protein